MSAPVIITLADSAILTAEQRAAIIALCSRAYDTDFEPIFRTYQAPTCVMGWLGDTLVSHALWVTRWLQVGDGPLLRTAFVEAVATEPTYQGQGHASVVMQALQDHIQDFDLGGLSPATYDLYQRLGWELWRGPLFIRTAEGLLPTLDEEAMVLRLPRTPALDLDASLSAEWREGELW